MRMLSRALSVVALLKPSRAAIMEPRFEFVDLGWLVSGSSTREQRARSLDPGRFAGSPAGQVSGAFMAKVEDAVRRCLGL